MKKYDISSIITIQSAQIIFNRGVTVIVTDGRYVEINKEDKDGL